MQTLQDRHVVVTGGTGALGAAVVLKFIEAGAVCHIPAIESTAAGRPASGQQAGQHRPRTSISPTRPPSTASTPGCRRFMPS